jgi:hypothetical protein
LQWITGDKKQVCARILSCLSSTTTGTKLLESKARNLTIFFLWRWEAKERWKPKKVKNDAENHTIHKNNK